MNVKLNQHELKALLCVVPKHRVSCEQRLKELGYSESKIKFFKENYGYESAHISDENTFASELCKPALKALFDEKLARKDELDALIITTQTPDYFAPSVSSLVHKELNLPSSTLCFDKVGYCTSFINSLFETFLLLENPHFKKVALVCVSVKSKKINPKDSLNFVSDSASVLLLEKSQSPKPCFYKSELLSEFALDETKPTSAYKKGFSEFIITDNNLIFQVVQQELSAFLDNFLSEFALEKEKITQFFFNSANYFFHTKLIQSLNLTPNLCFNAANSLFANADCNNIPLNLCLAKNSMASKTAYYGGGVINTHNQPLPNQPQKDINFSNVLLTSFGTGLNISAMTLDLRTLSVAKICEL